MTAPPMSHHEILGLVEPYTRRGRHVDLAASDRLERRLAFQPVEHAGQVGETSALRENLVLENPWPGMHRLTRLLVARLFDARLFHARLRSARLRIARCGRCLASRCRSSN